MRFQSSSKVIKKSFILNHIFHLQNSNTVHLVSTVVKQSLNLGLKFSSCDIFLNSKVLFYTLRKKRCKLKIQICLAKKHDTKVSGTVFIYMHIFLAKVYQFFM